MRTPVLVAVALAFVGAGCTTTARLYPVSGPILSQHATSLNTTLTNAPAGHGKIELALPDGELVKGEYSTKAGGSWSFDSQASSSTPPEGAVVIAASDWATVFGPSFSVAKMERGEGKAAGNKGTVFTLEFAVNGMSGRGYGVAKDSKGNLYRFELAGLESGTGPSPPPVPPEQPPRRSPR